MAKAKQRVLVAALLLAPLAFTGFLAFRIAAFTRYLASRPKAPGEVEFLDANRLLLMHRGENAFGNTDEARALARRYSAAQSALRAKLFEGGHRAELSLTEGVFLVYVHLTDEACVFLVHVPELRQYTREARAELRRRSWSAARDLLAEQHADRERMAVALRGPLLFDSIAIGEPDEEPDVHTDALVDPSPLYTYFRADAPAAAQPTAAPALDLSLLPGRWTHDRGDHHTEAVLAAAGTFHGRLRDRTREITFSGRWTVDADVLTWIYLESSVPPSLERDRNVILTLTASRLHVREMDGTTTLWKRATAP